MVEPGSSLPGAADDTGISPATPTVSPASSGRGWSSYSNNKKLAIGGGVGLVFGVGLWLYGKRKAANATTTTSTPGSGNTAPEYVLPSSNQDAVQGANDAALDTALGSIGSQLNAIGNDVNNQPAPIVTVTNNGTPTGGTTAPAPVLTSSSPSLPASTIQEIVTRSAAQPGSGQKRLIL